MLQSISSGAVRGDFYFLDTFPLKYFLQEEELLFKALHELQKTKSLMICSEALLHRW